MSRRRSLGWPITLATVMIVLLVALIVGWVLLSIAASHYADYWWILLGTGTAFLLLLLVGVIIYLLISIKEIALNRRQSNFIDSVTHELKSPIASLKLYLQTLSRRNVTEAQQADFHRFMLQDLERLDDLINHLLDAARLEHEPAEQEPLEVQLDDVLRACAATALQRHHRPAESIELRLQPAVVRGRPVDVEIVFRNLIDNALKYSGEQPHVTVELFTSSRGIATTRVIDNGPGIPHQWRRKIFARFVRLGNELERAQPGTGLGLYLVDTLIKRLRGKVVVRGRGAQAGTIFEVQLPGRAGTLAPLQTAAEPGQLTSRSDPVPPASSPALRS